jgi:pimeloyl-ACP methyl ester carboxylesterase
MATIVLVHGAWQSAATWDLVVPELRREGHEIYIPALTGLEPAGPRLGADVTLDTHIEDVLRMLESQNLSNVILVGHSYAGMIITGVAERVPARLTQLIYADAFVPNDGESVMQLQPENFRAMFRKQAAAEPDGFRLKASERQLDLWGLKPSPAREFVRARLCDFTIRCFEQSLRLPAQNATKLERTYISCVASDYPARVAFEPFARRAKAEGWHHYELPTGHDCHVEMPTEFSHLLTSRSAPP